MQNQVNLTSYFYNAILQEKFVKLHIFSFLEHWEFGILVVSISQIVGSFNMGTKMPGRVVEPHLQ